MLKARLFLIRTLTPLHVGSGRSSRAVDLPVQRDTEGLPMIPSTSIRGAFRTVLRSLPSIDDSALLGDHIGEIARLRAQPRSGNVFFTDAYLLLYPLSCKDRRIYVTSRYCIDRALRMLSLSNRTLDISMKDAVDIERISIKIGNELYYLSLRTGNRVVGAFNELLSSFSVDDSENVAKSVRLVEMENRKFAELTSYYNIKVYRIAMKDKLYLLKRVEEGALWCEEYVPRDTFFIAALAYFRDVESILDTVLDKLHRGVIQLGGRETVGKGFCRIYIECPSKNTYKNDEKVKYHN